MSRQLHSFSPHSSVGLSRSALFRARLVLLAGLLVSLSFVIPNTTACAEEVKPSLEYQVKASLIFNFLQFIEWPPEIWNSPGPLRICVAGENKFGSALKVIEREIVRGKRLQVEHHPSLDEGLAACNVVFFSGANGDERQPVLAPLGSLSILTIGEDHQFLSEGGVVSLLRDDDKIVFDISRAAALRSRLNISSKLLRIAHAVLD